MVTNTCSLFTSFENLTDPRSNRGNLQHSLYDMVVVTICATICGADSWTDVERFGWQKIDWFKSFLELENDIPSHDTFGRVFAALDTASFSNCLQDWIDTLQLELAGQGIHIDGKTARRSFDAATNRKSLHLVSAWADGLNLCLGQVAVEEKSNEIKAVPMLLELLELRNSVVTLDAMHCQTASLAKIIDKEADYVVTVKRNQHGAYEQIEKAFLDYGEDNFRSPKCRTYRSERTLRGRIEERVVTVAPAPRSLKETDRWSGLKTIGMVYRHREADPASQSKEPIPSSDHVTYFMSSLPPKVGPIASHVNKHWTVENQLHWSLDVTFKEDSSRIRKGNGQEVIAMFRRLALSILKRDTSLPKESLRGKRLIAGWNDEALSAIISGA